MNNESLKFRPRVLVAPLDWGLGHATRCIPVIRQLLQADCEVLLAGEDKIRALLQAEFPQLPFLSLKGYRINYAKSRRGLVWKMVRQVPKILAAIRDENAWLQEVVRTHNLHAVISDNRYGLHHPGLPTIFITHQLRIRTPFGEASEKILQELNYRYIRRFTSCWVPDWQPAPGLAGALSHPIPAPPLPVQYVGPLSRFAATPASSDGSLLLLLSGPEPQRTILEEMLLQQLEGVQQPVVLVRGLPGVSGLPRTRPGVTVHNHLPASALQEVLGKAALVVSRCGYSTVMDLVALGKRSILIPTPGQTEQEYLAEHLMQEGLALCLPQKDFALQPALDRAASFSWRAPSFPPANQLEDAVTQLLQQVMKHPYSA